MGGSCRMLAVWALVGALGVCLPRQGAAAEGPEAFRFLVYGGTSGDAAVHRALVARMAPLRPDFVLHTGEVVADPQRGGQWADFEEITRPLRSLCPFYASAAPREWGRHFTRLFGPPKGASGKASYYSFEHNGAHFLVLDAELPTSRDDPQTRWLAADVAAAKGKPVFVLLHSPLYGVVAKGRHPLGHLYWQPLFVRHHVTAVFSGAHHLYYRTVQGGVPHIVTAAGGAMFNRIESRRSLLPGDVVAVFHHFLEVTVSPGAIRCRVVDHEGRTRDEFDLPLPPKPGADGG